MCIARLLSIFRKEKPVEINPVLLGTNLTNQFGEWIRERVRKDDVPDINFFLVDDDNTIAYTAGSNIYLGKLYFSLAPDVEDKGVIIHELTHAIERAPVYEGDFKWLIEGLADFVRLELGFGVFDGSQNDDPRNGGYGSGAYFFKWLYTSRRYAYDSIVDSMNKGIEIKTIDAYVNDYLRGNK